MSMKTLPLVFINLGGEMLSILDHPLQAHSTSEGKSEKVMNDIVGNMFSEAFMDELLKPQLLYSHRTIKVELTRLAIMKLKTVSMEKLYELMIMAFKYHVFHCPRPKDLLLISYNHIDTIREFVKDTPAVVNKVDETHRKIIELQVELDEHSATQLAQIAALFAEQEEMPDDVNSNKEDDLLAMMDDL
ncbi:protein OSCP1-like [Phyllopteryx taeniolatus]|uniref:protein OSCP1-like n=1 Tax=Phyllopteryx taeniolatus TaxID=161469 RepID=UPI002AD1D20D|nr:protein OSCP1-like [Phyllopteryx taeniolatus]